MSTIKNFGIAGVSSDLQLGKKGGRFIYDDGVFTLAGSDGEALSRIKVAEGTEADDAVNLDQVQQLIDAIDVTEELGTMAEQDADSVAITGGSIDGTTIGGDTAAAGTFTTLNADSGEIDDLVVDNELSVDTIVENTEDAGVTVDGVLLQDGEVEASEVRTGTIAEAEEGQGVNVAHDLTAQGNVVIEGDLTVNGETTTLDVTNLEVEDNVIRVNRGYDASAGDIISGIEVVTDQDNDEDVVGARWVFNTETNSWEAQVYNTSEDEWETASISGNFEGSDLDFGFAETSLVRGDTTELEMGDEHQVLTVGESDIEYAYVSQLRNGNGDVTVETSDADASSGEYLDVSNEEGQLTLTAKNASEEGDVDLVLVAQGDGDVLIGDPLEDSVIAAQDNRTLTVAGGDSDGEDAGNLELFGGNGDDTHSSGDVILQGGTGGSAEGITIIRDSDGNEIATFEAGESDADDFITVKNGNGDATIEAAGDSTDVDLVLAPKGDGLIVAPTGYDVSDGSDEALANKGYVDSVVEEVANNVDPLILRESIVADGSETSFEIGTMNDIEGKTYYVHRVVLHVTSSFEGNDVDNMVVSDGTNTLADADDSDIESGTYIIDLPFADATDGGATISVEFNDDSDSSVAPSSGEMVAVVEYKVL